MPAELLTEQSVVGHLRERFLAQMTSVCVVDDDLRRLTQMRYG